MARLGALRTGDLRCLSATFMVVVFFCCVFMLSLQPSRYPTKLSMVDLPKDEVVRAQSIPALAPPGNTNTQNAKTLSSSGKEGKKNNNGKGADQKNAKNDKKASKAKWFKDELPKKLHTGHVRNNTKAAASKGIEAPASQDAQDKNITDAANSPESLPPAAQADMGIPEPSQADTQPPTRKEASNSTESHSPKVETEDQQADPSSQVAPPLRPKTSFSNLNNAPVHAFVSPFIESKTKGVEEQKKKVITWYEADDERVLSRRRKALENCPDSRCKLVHPLPGGMRADAVVFESEHRGRSPPVKADRDQVFVLHAMGPRTLPRGDVWRGAWKSAFNWTWSYRSGSDIWQPFGLLKRAKKVKPLEYFDALTKLKSRAVAWMPRTCPETTTSSKRNEFIEELSKHVRVTEFGPCSNKSCAKAGTPCSDNLTKKFFFLLAVEDDLCEDRVTEVFYRAWQEKTHLLPVVRGGTDYASYFPEGTYIDTDWFDSVKQLSEFLVELVASRKIYSQLLWRKAHWVKSTKHPEEKSLCNLCDKLHNLSSNRKWYSDIQSWYDESVCKEPKMF
ncbi:uncharacterized protein LOC143296988 [Babylonia areolata]|uniref:uncharacterized protein LOC143296988 n=1 Tax=Babylonia areolata TaxID=304850 RepID=UPI003FCF39B9